MHKNVLTKKVTLCLRLIFILEYFMADTLKNFNFQVTLKN